MSSMTIMMKHAPEREYATSKPKGNLNLHHLLDGSFKHLIQLILAIGLHDENNLLRLVHVVSLQNEAAHIAKLDDRVC